MLENPLCDSLDPILQGYYNDHVQKNDDKRKNIVNNLNQEIGKIIDKLRNTKNPLFNQYYLGIVYTGSYWDRIKVKLATEFDVNLVFKLPSGIKVNAGSPPGHTYLKLAQISRPNRPKNPHYRYTRGTTYCRKYIFETVKVSHAEALETYSEISCWTNGTFIRPDKFLSWMEGLFARAGIITRQNVNKSGPALTVTMRFDARVTVDFTPVFELQQLRPSEERCLAVPKPYPGMANTWRISICEMEKKMFKDKQFSKFILKLVKKVRDNFDMPKLSSYYIKTLFLWEVRQPNINWSVHVGRLFMHMMEKLECALGKKTIPSIVDGQLNILQLSLKPSTIENMYHRIKRFNNEMIFILHNPQDKRFKRMVEDKLNGF